LLWYLVVCGLGVVFLIPFFWMVSTSLKIDLEAFRFPPQWIPRPVTWENYVFLFTTYPFGTYLRNTVFVTGASALGSVLSSSLVAYGFARLRFEGRDILFFILLATMMLPGQVTMIPLFLMFHKIHWIDTFYPLIVPAYCASPFYVFLIRQFFMTISYELDDAARIDGAGFLRTYWNILVPLSRPVLGVVGVFSLTSHWQDFMGPLIYLNSRSKFTIALALRFFQNELGLLHVQELMAASTIAMLPLLVIFFLGQDYFIGGVVLSGMK